MDYRNLSQHQVIRTILDDNPAKRSPKQIADFLGLSLSSVEKWGESPEGAGSHMSIKYILPFSFYTQDPRLIEYFAFHMGKKLIDLEPIKKCNGDILDEVFNLDIWRGRLSAALKFSLGDGQLDEKEKKKLSGIAANMISELRTFQKELEEGK